MIKELYDLQNNFFTQAKGVYTTYGQGDPVARAFLECYRDLIKAREIVDVIVNDLVDALETCADPTSGVDIHQVAQNALDKFNTKNKLGQDAPD